MRILSRPMFKYGGPIKEGVMSGMKNGGTAGVGHGLVGDQRYPKTGGREHHVLPLAALGWAGARMAARPFGRWAMKNIPKMFAGPGKPTWNIGKGFRSAPGYTQNVSQRVFQPNWLGKQFIKDPLAQSVMTGSSAFGKGVQWTAKKGLAAGKYAFGTPSGLLFMGLPVTYYGGKYILSKTGEEITGDDLNKITQGPGEKWSPGVGGEQYDPSTAPSAMAAAAKKARKAKIAKYMDTMGYDRAQKTAVGKALIDASAIVQAGTEEGGSLKHADWSKMINQAIQATSKRLDKPAQIREAIGLMMTKADIQKDMSAEENALAKLLTTKRIEKLNKELEGNTFAQNKILTSKTMPGQSGIDTAVQLTEGKNFRGNIINTSDFNKILKKMKKETGMDDQTVIINWAQAVVDKNPDGFEDGHYTVGNNVITVKDDQVIAVE